MRPNPPGNSGGPPGSSNRRPPIGKLPTNMEKEEIMAELKLDTTEAERSLKKLRSEAARMSTIVGRGTDRGGILMPSDVRAQERSFKQIEDLYRAHYDRLNRVKSAYSNRVQGLKGDITWRAGEIYRLENSGASPKIIDHHKRKMSENQGILNTISSPTYKAGYKQRLRRYEDTVGQMNEAREDSLSSRESIGNMRERSRFAAHASYHAVSGLATAGVITSVGGLMHYFNRGIDDTRKEKLEASVLGQKMASGYNGDDTSLRLKMQAAGIQNQYNTSETLQTASILATGGLANTKDLQSDLLSVQQMSRAYGLDANEVATDASGLRRMGTFEQGEMQRFADMIGGSVAKNGMRGREGEMLRSTMNLANRVGSNLDKLTKEQFGNILGAQVALGDAVPTLKGERGANVLSNIDSSIKNSSNDLDILMGKGWKEGYIGEEGAMRLKYQQEEGISNPENMKLALEGADAMMTGETPEMKWWRVRETLSREWKVSRHTLEAMHSSGYLDKMRNGDMEATDEQRAAIEKAGGKDILDQWSKYRKSDSADWLGLEATTQKDRTQMSDKYERMSRGLRGAFHSLPVPLQEASMFGTAAAGIGMYANRRRISNWLGRFSAPIWEKYNWPGGGTGGGGWKARLSGYGAQALDAGKDMWGRFTSTIGKPGMAVPGSSVNWGAWLQRGKEGLSNFYQSRINPTGWMSSLSSNVESLGGRLGSLGTMGGGIIRAVGKYMPAIGAGYDYLRGDSAVQSIGKAGAGWAGAGLGAKAGAALGTAIAPGIGTVAGGLLGAVAGGYLGYEGAQAILGSDATANKLEASGSNPESPSYSGGSSGGPSSVDTLSVNTLNIMDKSLADILSGGSSSAKNVDAMGEKIAKVAQQYQLEIVISGKIDGMNDKNQTEVTDSIGKFFNSLLKGTTSNKFNLNWDSGRART